MMDKHIKKARLVGSNGDRVTGDAIRKWFVPLYFDYCRSMQLTDCGKEKDGCGVNDKCPVDTICNGQGSTHKCSGKYVATIFKHLTFAHADSISFLIPGWVILNNLKIVIPSIC